MVLSDNKEHLSYLCIEKDDINYQLKKEIVQSSKIIQMNRKLSLKQYLYSLIEIDND